MDNNVTTGTGSGLSVANVTRSPVSTVLGLLTIAQGVLSNAGTPHSTADWLRVGIMGLAGVLGLFGGA